jgi:CheY-like chemotaxis protein
MLSNAIKFTAQGEVVLTVAVSGQEMDACHVHFSVRDTGIGIPPDKLAKLFTPFVQADVSTSRVFGGTGLGLSIVKRLVELMGGTVQAHSIPGEGSTFAFELPLRATESHAPEPAAIRDARVLVVDDNVASAQVLTRMLCHLGYHADSATSADAALQALSDAAESGRAYAVLLIDSSLPETNTVQLAQHIAGDPRLCAAQRVLMTPVAGCNAEVLASGGFTAGLAKPVRTAHLAACLDRLLEPTTGSSVCNPDVPRHAPLAGSEPDRGACVLVVEDNAVNQKVAARFLERLGCQVTIAKDGAEGAAVCRPGTFDLVLMDVQMPVLDGYAATRRIREQERGTAHRVPILALTADAMSGQAELCHEAGMDGLLTKPIQLEQLRRVLDERLAESPRIRAATG